MTDTETEIVEMNAPRAEITLKAVVTTTDQGVFEAVISTESVDREKDVVRADAMVAALRKWPRQIPLAWEHRTNAEDIFGAIDPPSVKNVDGEVVAGGKVDLESPVGREAWRSFKSRTLGFSFGYLLLKFTKRDGGGRDITELDVFEITATRAPMNNDTRVLSTKATETLKKESERRAREIAEAQIPELPPAQPGPLPPKVEDLAEELAEVKSRLAAAETALTAPPDTEALRKESQRLEREIAAATIPELPPAEPEPKEPEVDLLKELQEVKARLESTEQALDILKKKAEEADKEPSARSVDPLRKRSEELALEIASDGMSLRKPPAQVKTTKPDPVDADGLRQQSRDLMFEVLSYSTE